MPQGYDAQVRAGYLSNAVVQRAVRLVAEGVGGAPLDAGDPALATLIGARGLMEAVANRYPNLDLGIVTIPSMFMTALPYILTVIILAGFVGRAIPPRAGGEPYVKER